MERLTLLFSLLFYGYAIWHYGSSTSEFIFQMIVGTILFVIFVYFRHDRKEQEQFQLWLDANQREILTGGAYYQHIEITPVTRFVQYDALVSFGLFHSHRQSRYFIEEVHLTMLHKMTFVLITLLLGWWSFPFGPILTIPVLWRNLRGGHRTTYQEMLQG